jgi:hypothetical protein
VKKYPITGSEETGEVGGSMPSSQEEAKSTTLEVTASDLESIASWVDYGISQMSDRIENTEDQMKHNKHGSAMYQYALGSSTTARYALQLFNHIAQHTILAAEFLRPSEAPVLPDREREEANAYARAIERLAFTSPAGSEHNPEGDY